MKRFETLLSGTRQLCKFVLVLFHIVVLSVSLHTMSMVDFMITCRRHTRFAIARTLAYSHVQGVPSPDGVAAPEGFNFDRLGLFALRMVLRLCFRCSCAGGADFALG